jgi:hypothetical protein
MKMFRTIEYAPVTVPPGTTMRILPTRETMEAILRWSSYKPLDLGMSQGPFIVKVRWGAPYEEFIFDMATQDKKFKFDIVQSHTPADPIEFTVQNMSNEPAPFEAVMTVEASTEKTVPEMMADDMAADIADNVAGASFTPEIHFTSDEEARGCFSHDHGLGNDRTNAPLPKGNVNRMKDRLKAALGYDSLNLDSIDPLLSEDVIRNGPKLSKIIKTRFASIVDNVMRAVEVVVRDAADKLDDEGDRKIDDILPIIATRPPIDRNMVIGFSPKIHGEKVPPGVSANITVNPQVVFKMKKLIIPDDVAKAFDILDIKVGKNSQFATANSVPAEIFAASKGGELVTTDTCHVSMDLTICVLNKSSEPVAFRAAGVGEIVDGPSYPANDAVQAVIRRGLKRRARNFPSFLS